MLIYSRYLLGHTFEMLCDPVTTDFMQSWLFICICFDHLLFELDDKNSLLKKQAHTFYWYASAVLLYFISTVITNTEY